MSADTLLWSKLLPSIAKGQVIPIIGRDLLRVSLDGREQLLNEWLPVQVAARLGLDDLPAPLSLDSIVVAHLDRSRRNKRDDIYPVAWEILNDLRAKNGGRLPVPEPLRKLAEIVPFKLWVTTTVSPFLAETLGVPDERVFAYAPNGEVRDLPRDLPGRSVFHLFGKISAIPDSALLEEDVLEFLWNLHAESLSSRLANLFDELRAKRLLLIGNSHPDWLARFFLRLSKRERLCADGDTHEFLAEPGLDADLPLHGFLENFSCQTGIFAPQDSVGFVDLLSEKWRALQPPPAAPGAAPALIPSPSPGGRPPAVFISYASADRPLVEHLSARLDAAGLDVWFDRERLQSGDAWWPVIDQNIAACDLFLPIISARTQGRDEGIFLREWNRAIDRLQTMDRETARFIHPVIIDETPDGAVSYRPFHELNYTRAPQGEPAPEFVQGLVALVRQRRSRRGALTP